MKKRLLCLLLVLAMVLSVLPFPAFAQEVEGAEISSFSALKAAFSAGGTYRMTEDIIVTSGLNLPSGVTLTIYGNGHVLSPAVTGMNEQGVVNNNATYISAVITNNGTLTIHDLTVYGGKGRCINNNGNLTMNNVAMERAHQTSEYGAGIYNAYAGKILMIGCTIRRNGCDSAGGGFFNKGTIIMENSSIVENRNFGGSTGGGGGENNNGTIYMNNCTVANNQSSEIGGGINNYRGTLYIMNSVFTGNVTTSSSYDGGAIGNNGGAVYAVNSVFAFNYSGTGSQIENDDIDIYSGNNVKLYNCAYHTASNGVTVDDCIQVTDVEEVFNGSRESGSLDKDGNETQSVYVRPVITVNDGDYCVYPKDNSPILNGGIVTYYERDGFTVKMSYGEENKPLGSLSAAANASNCVDRYQDGSDRPTGSTIIGALPANQSYSKVYTVIVSAIGKGTVIGGSSHGDTYRAGWSGSIEAVAHSEYYFAGWIINDGDQVTDRTNPYVIEDLQADLVLTPVFVSNPTYYVTADIIPADGGTVEGSGCYEEGENVTLAICANDGYTLDTITVDGDVVSLTDDTYSFYMPAREVTVVAEFKEDASECDHSGNTNEQWTEEDDSTHSNICSECGELIVEEHTYPQGVCICGKKLVFVVTWDVNGATTTEEYNYGDTPRFTGSTDKAADAQYTYTFAGWDPEIAPVTGDAAYTATYTKSTNKYTVKFVNEDGTELQSGEVAYGTMPAYTGAAPTKAADARYTYTFKGWSPALKAVSGAATYTATYTETVNKYTVRFVDWNGTELESQTVAYGSDAANPTVPTRTGYTFTGWDKAFDNVCGDLTVTAQYEVNQYTISFDTDGGSSIASITQDYGSELTKPADPTKLGHTFAGWEPAVPVTMPGGDMTLKAKWTVNVYSVTLIAKYGTIETGNITEYIYGVGAQLPTEVRRFGYAFGGWYDNEDLRGEPITEITDTDLGDKTFYAKWKSGNSSGGGRVDTQSDEYGDECKNDHTCPIWNFDDARTTAWYHDGVHYCLEEELMNGVSDDLFAPNDNTTRAMIVTILWRLEGEPVVNYAMDFSDVSADTWYTEAVRWAASEKIVDGWNGKFDPMGDITREQFAAILWRYAKYCGMDVSVGEDTNILSYDDAFDVAEWSIPAMRWVCGAGIIQGIADGKATNLEPQSKATRAQAATILYRFCELTEEEN